MSERVGAVVASGDVDATVVLPTPGRKRSPYAPSLERPAAAADLAKLGGLNALVQADRDWAVRGLVAELHPELCPLR